MQNIKYRIDKAIGYRIHKPLDIKFSQITESHANRFYYEMKFANSLEGFVITELIINNMKYEKYTK
jgi:hypothetical protein